MALYVEQFLDSLNGLPADLRTNLTKMRTLDGDVQQKLSELDRDMRVYVRGGKHVSRDQRLKRYSAIEKLVDGAQKKSEEKVKLANETYDLVDKQIRKLDDYLERFQADLKRKYVGQAQTPKDKKSRKAGEKTPKSALTGGEKSGKKRRAKDDGRDGNKKKRRKLDDSDRASPTNAAGDLLPDVSGQEILKQLAGGDDVMNMPIDPNEPTYCVCQKVSFGDMIACDNPNCRIEWFHMSCVGLKTIPKGKYFCRICDEERKKKKKSMGKSDD